MEESITSNKDFLVTEEDMVDPVLHYPDASETIGLSSNEPTPEEIDDDFLEVQLLSDSEDSTENENSKEDSDTEDTISSTSFVVSDSEVELLSSSTEDLRSDASETISLFKKKLSHEEIDEVVEGTMTSNKESFVVEDGTVISSVHYSDGSETTGLSGNEPIAEEIDDDSIEVELLSDSEKSKDNESLKDHSDAEDSICSTSFVVSDSQVELLFPSTECLSSDGSETIVLSIKGVTHEEIYNDSVEVELLSDSEESIDSGESKDEEMVATSNVSVVSSSDNYEVVLLERKKTHQKVSQDKQRKRKNQRSFRAQRTESKKKFDKKKAREGMKKYRESLTKEEKENIKKGDRERKYKQRLAKKFNTEFLEKMDIDEYNFELYMKSIQMYHCKVCNKKQLQKPFEKKPCKDCLKFSKHNDMDPGDVPPRLQNLSFSEQQLIALIHTTVSLFQIKKCQYKYKGHIINFPQHVQEVASALPHDPKKLSSIITIRLPNSGGYKDFRVRRPKVRDAIECLIETNPHYKHIVINEEILESLPEDGNIYNELRGYDTETATLKCDCDMCQEPSEDDVLDTVIDDGDDVDDIVITDVPDLKDATQNDQLKNSLGEPVLIWPTIGSTPINEFGSPGYISMAFPYLFPYGTADYSMPRETKISFNDYCKHLMLYYDGRFATDARFRYFLMNSQMRWTALNVGNIIVQKNEFFNKQTVLQLKEYLKKHPNVIQQIMFYSSRIRSTRPYWNTRCAELLDMVLQTGTPTIFFSLSSADLHWPDIYRLLGFNVVDLSYKDRAKLLSDNPLLFDSFFVLRARYYIEHIMVKKFDIKDYWYRFEFQHRGSIHLHGVAWLKNAPDVGVDPTQKVQADILSYFSNLISCNNPDANVEMSDIHPSQKYPSEVEDKEKDYGELVNTFQRHTKCSKNYCLQQKKNSKDLKCRYGFPKDLNEDAYVSIKDNKIDDIVFERNDPRVNKHNRWMLQSWRANIDVSPIFNEDSVMRYIAKYASKSESKSMNYTSLVNSLSFKLDTDRGPCKKLIRKILISCCAERDYSAQEVMHFLMGHGFYHCSRQFVVLNYKQLSFDNFGKHGKYKSLIEHYIQRPVYLEEYSLFDFARKFHMVRGKLTCRLKPSIVRIFPKLNIAIGDSLTDEETVDVLFAFFVPWENEQDLQIAFEKKLKRVRCVKSQIYTSMSIKALSDIVEKYGDENDKDEFNSLIESDKPLSSDEKDVDYISSYNPNRVDTGEVKKIGKRDIDMKHNWESWNCPLNIDDLDDLYKSILEDQLEEKMFDVDESLLDDEQLKVFQKLCSEVEKVKNGEDIVGSVTVVQGGAGTGKSYLLKCMFNHIYYNIGGKSVQKLGPTGVSSKNVDGITINSFLRLGKKVKNFVALKGDSLCKFQRERKDIMFLLIDEYSLIGCSMFAAIESRVRQMKDSDYYFGNIFVYFFGDCNQLPPIADPALFSILNSCKVSNVALQGQLLFKNIDDAYELSINYRSKSKKYSEFLNRVANGTCTSSDMERLRKQNISIMSIAEQKCFKNAIRICSTNVLSDDNNINQLLSLNVPIATVKAKNSSKSAFNSSDKEADDLPNVLYIAVGAKVNLTRNLNVTRGLVNGAIGEIVDILYSKDSVPPELPCYVLIRFNEVNLDGFTYDFVPIRPVLASWLKSDRCTRLQLPLSLAWSYTIHKSQCLGFKRIILELSDSEFVTGLLYVALSRISRFTDMLLLTGLSLERLNAIRRSVFYEFKLHFLKWIRSFHN